MLIKWPHFGERLRESAADTSNDLEPIDYFKLLEIAHELKSQILMTESQQEMLLNLMKQRCESGSLERKAYCELINRDNK